MINNTHFLVILTSQSCNHFFRDIILDSASLDSATKSDLQATGIDLKNTAKVENTLEKKSFNNYTNWSHNLRDDS